MEVVESGDAHLRRLLTAIAAARREVALEIYQIRDDAVGGPVLEELAVAARRGVRTRVLVDAFGSFRLGSAAVHRLRGAGAEVTWYNPWRPWHDPQRRTHRKLALVDGRLASVGGFNLVEDFSESLRGDSAWRDMSVWLEGSAASTLASQFEAAWRRAGGLPGTVVRAPAPGTSPCAVAGGVDGREGHALAYAGLFEAATSEILIANPYFIPLHGLRSRLAAAARRGVRVVVTVPRRSDIAAFKHASRGLYGELLAAGVEIWERTDRMVHAKVAAVDGVLAAVGSTNLNRRSLQHNSETLLLSPEPALVEAVRRLVLVEAAGNAEPLYPRAWMRHSDRRHVAEALASAVSVLL